MRLTDELGANWLGLERDILVVTDSQPSLVMRWNV